MSNPNLNKFLEKKGIMQLKDNQVNKSRSQSREQQIQKVENANYESEAQMGDDKVIDLAAKAT